MTATGPVFVSTVVPDDLLTNPGKATVCVASAALFAFDFFEPLPVQVGVRRPAHLRRRPAPASPWNKFRKLRNSARTPCTCSRRPRRRRQPAYSLLTRFPVRSKGSRGGWRTIRTLTQLLHHFDRLARVQLGINLSYSWGPVSQYDAGGVKAVLAPDLGRLRMPELMWMPVRKLLGPAGVARGELSRG